MKLKRLFEIQKELDDHIIEKKGLQEKNVLPELFLALHSEIGEFLNEWRGFKFWSEDQEPNIKPYTCKVCCEYSIGYGDSNPLLEEYIDCLHFLLSIGNKTGADEIDWIKPWQFHHMDVKDAILGFIDAATNYRHFPSPSRYESLMKRFIDIGYLLGYSLRDIEEAYLTKNKINHERQETGY